MTRSILPIGLALAIGTAPACVASPVPDFKPLAQGNAAFAFDLYAKLKGEPGNLFFSPFSISAALSMTAAGAKGETLAQMEKTLHLPADPHAGFEAMIGRMNAADPAAYKLSVANALFGQKGYPWVPAFVGGTAKHYGAGLREVDYANPELARQEINAWVEEKTAKKITDLMPAGSLDEQTRLVLVNAIYFKGSWAKAFDPKATQKAPFKISAGEKADVPLMWTRNSLPYAENDDLQIVALPYKKGELSMLVLLPKKADGLADLEAKLTATNAAKWIAGMKATDNTAVYLPKFKLTGKFGLGSTLASMGMADAFDAKRADFSGMDGRRDLMIGAVVHKSFVDVNEEGTEAAAATGVAMMPRAMKVEPKPTPVVRCDHPFLFMIRDNASGSILFLGRMSQPKE